MIISVLRSLPTSRLASWDARVSSGPDRGIPKMRSRPGDRWMEDAKPDTRMSNVLHASEWHAGRQQTQHPITQTQDAEIYLGVQSNVR